jgi:hypothetical protein
MAAQPILICSADDEWTLEALHLASAASYHTGQSIILLQMVPVDHPYYLGQDFENRRYSAKEQRIMRQFQRVLEEYGVSYQASPFQYVSLAEAIVDAAEQFDAATVFATLPASRLPFWRRFEMWSLRRTMKRQQRAFYALDDPLEGILLPTMPEEPEPVQLDAHHPA